MRVNFETLRSAAEAAALLGVSPSRILQWVGEERLAGRVIGNTLVIPQESLDRLQRRPRGRPPKGAGNKSA